MPRKPAKKLTAKEKEQYFISLYVKEGATVERLSYCEKRAFLDPGAGAKLLAKKSVQDKIKERMKPVQAQQVRAEKLPEAVAVAEQVMQEKLSAVVQTIQLKKIQPEILEHELMMGVVGLNWHMFPKEKLDAIKAAYIIAGTLESNGIRRLMPAQDTPTDSSTALYTSLFNRIASQPQKQEAPLESTAKPEDGVYDIVPPAPQDVIPPPKADPAQKSGQRVITVEIG